MPYWTPSGTYFSVSNTPTQITSVSGQIDGLARITNVGATAASVGFTTAGGTIGSTNLVNILSQTDLYIAFGVGALFIVATGATCLSAPGYALKDKTGDVV